MMEMSSVKLPLTKDILLEMESCLGPEHINFAQKRKESFLAGRYCAKNALKKLGFEVNSLAADESGKPIWPKGICGSISHSKSLGIAVVSDSHKSVGIDVEKIIEKKRLDRIQRIFISDFERDLYSLNRELNGSLIFSAKEALFKLINPLCHEYFGFFDAYLVEIDSHNFQIKLQSEKPNVAKYNDVYRGEHWIIEDQVVTLLAI